MGEHTEIAWTDATWNPWQGCRKVSEACANCYMYRDMKRYGKDGSFIRRSGIDTFGKPMAWAKNRAKYGHINRVFTCSWADFFIEEADKWRPDAWEIIRKTPNLTYQILTKRTAQAAFNLPDGDDTDLYNDWPHVWLGATVELAKHVHRIEDLWHCAPRVLFMSVEPMLGPIDNDLHGIDWVICGCESGPGARETRLEWVRDLRDQCLDVGIPFFLKQLMVNGKLTITPELDGRQWVEFPKVKG